MDIKSFSDNYNDVFPAHIRKENDDLAIQTVSEHCKGTAAIASDCLRNVNLNKTAYVAGLLHDLGKYTENFKKYIWSAAKGESVVRGSVNHTFAGVKYLLDKYHTDENGCNGLATASELVAFVIGSHHGLFDCIDENHRNGFVYRQKKTDIFYEEAVDNYFKDCCSESCIKKYINEACEEITPILQKLYDISSFDEKGNENEKTWSECSFYSSLLVRLILSAVIEGDRRDTASFMNNKSKYVFKMADWNYLLIKVESKVAELPNKTFIQQARKKISDLCCKFADKPSGVYRLNVPTGAGKTLSSLRYALAHAKKWNKSKIVFVSPLLSILEQNAKIIRDYVQNDDLILEHHSNIIVELDNTEELDKYELLSESWNSPIIITTLVQLLNTLFSGKSSSIRRFHSLVNSIIVIDEVQTVPNNMLSLFNLAVNFLSKICNSTIVLCSATQPCFEITEHALCSDVEDIISYDSFIWLPFKRTEIIDAGKMGIDDLLSFIQSKLINVSSLLIVCNKKNEAQTIYKKLSSKYDNCFHLSASMCIQHRRDVVKSIYKSLDTGKKTICVSTQVIEAGVDISFGCVIRLAAGMDSVIQSAGRCNRNGESKNILPVYIVQLNDEKLGALKDIERSQKATVDLLAVFKQNPNLFDNDYSSNKSISYYYKRLYGDMKKGFQDYFITNKEVSIFTLLSRNDVFDNGSCGSGYFLKQAFKVAGSEFRVFDENTTDVIVPYKSTDTDILYKSGLELINKLASDSENFNLTNLMELLKSAKPYTISVYNYQKEKLLSSGALQSICNGHVYYLNTDYYDFNVGLVDESSQNTDEMEFII